ncbi:MAG: EAL domain-containing protein [Aeromonadaceae bacterium]
MSRYKVKGIEFQLRLEPIVSLNNGEVIGFEALSRVTDSSALKVDYEVFFGELSLSDSLHLVERQMEIFQKWIELHPEVYKGKFLFVNVQPSILEDRDACHCFIPFLRYFPIGIEIDNHLSYMHSQALTNIAILKSYGAQVWIDDFPGHGEIKGNFWNGVKIDRWAFQGGFRRSMSGYGHADYSRACEVGPLVIEGIETEDHLDYAVSLGARYGQGYLWSERR